LAGPMGLSSRWASCGIERAVTLNVVGRVLAYRTLFAALQNTMTVQLKVTVLDQISVGPR